MYKSVSLCVRTLRDLAVLATAILTLAAMATGCASEPTPEPLPIPSSVPGANLASIPVSVTESISSGDVQLKSGTLTLNGSLQIADDAQPGQVVLMIHGTLAHNRMEIMQAFQERFSELGLSSLAITLSLGIDDRRGMFDCDQPHRHLHTDAITEIAAWYEWLALAGYSRISILGHSRGGNQVTLFSKLTVRPAPDALILVAPMTVAADAPAYVAGTNSGLGTLIEMAKQQLKSTGRQELMTVPRFLHCNESKVSPRTFLSYYNPRLGNDRDNVADTIEAYEPDTPALLRTVILPTLVIAGSEDNVSPDLRSRIEARPNIRVFQIEGADHFFRDLYADDATDEIASFLANIHSDR